MLLRPRKSALQTALDEVRQSEPQGIRHLVEDIESDYQFWLGKLTLKALFMASEITIEGVGDDPVAKAIADSVEYAWNEYSSAIFEAFAYGRAAFELEHRVVWAGGRPIKVIYDLLALPFENSEMVVERGQYAGARVWGRSRDRSVMLTPEESWWFALDPTAREPHGRSRYIGAPWQVRKRRKALEIQTAKWLDRLALGHGVGRAPHRYPKEMREEGDEGALGENGTVPVPADDLKYAIESATSGGTVILGSEKNEEGDYYFQYDPTKQQPDVTPIENAWAKSDVDALRSIGVPELSITITDAGARAMAEVHSVVLRAQVETIISPAAKSMQFSVLDPLLKMNYGSAPPPLLIGYKTFDMEVLNRAWSLAQILATNERLPALVRSGTVDVRQVFESAKVPLTDDVEASLARAIAQADVAAAVAAYSQSSMPMASDQRSVTMSVLRDLAAGPPDDAPNVDDIADEAAHDASRLWARIADVIGDGTRLDRDHL